jgi:hypothetical protein
MKKPTKSDQPPPLAVAAGSWEMIQDYPGLAEFLSCSVWDDGTVRVTGTLLLFADQGLWKVALHDRDGQRTAFFSGETVSDVLNVVDRALCDGRIGWRADTRRR